MGKPSRSPDFRGLATKSNIKCSDGRVIKPGAFTHLNGAKVPLVWMHGHNDPTNVIGHCYLDCRSNGDVWVDAYLNNTATGEHARQIVQHGDIDALSIFATNLREIGNHVEHGKICEVSMVIAGANPGAVITDVIQHSDGNVTVLAPDEAIMWCIEEGSFIVHAEPEEDSGKKTDKKTARDILDSMSAEKKSAIAALIAAFTSNGPADGNSDDEGDESSEGQKTIKEIFDSMTPEERAVADHIIGTALSEADSDKSVKHSDEEENKMKRNAFANDDVMTGAVLSEDLVHSIFKKARQCNSLRDALVQTYENLQKDEPETAAVLMHSCMHGNSMAHGDYGVSDGTGITGPGYGLGYGVSNIGMLFPDYTNITRTPMFIDRDQTWVADVLANVHPYPTARFRSVFADITEDAARAKGYITGKLKKEEVFTLLKRETGPTTVYKKQKMDRDYIIDLKDFDVLAWLRVEMRGKLNEELARAYLIGDGREADDDDKIKEDCIRPIWKDDPRLFVINTVISYDSTDPAKADDNRAKALIKAAIKSRSQYEGSGNPTMYTTEEQLSDMLLLTDEIGRDLYDSEAKLATKTRVKKIVSVPVMKNQTRTVSGKTRRLLAIIVNLNDYYVGSDKGGPLTMFNQFDIDYNAEKLLIETRCSGALVRPRSAIVIEEEVAA
jgi:hypothetical protein